jgi:hypothetical protein
MGCPCKARKKLQQAQKPAEAPKKEETEKK